VLDVAREMAEEALRVLATATKSKATLETAQHGLTFLGLAGMIDPPRPEAKNALLICEQAGIRTVMITGDHPVTAKAVASELGLLAESGRVVTGGELEEMPEEDLDRDVEDIQVYARVTPAHKLRVITAWQKRGYTVAMTGDGVNDAPALKKADIGIAMGITGTDVTKEAAAMTLTDDNFASIVAAVEEGRGVFGNIKKYLMFLLSSNIGEIGLMAGAALMGLPLPLSAVQSCSSTCHRRLARAGSLGRSSRSNLMKRNRAIRVQDFHPACGDSDGSGRLWSALVNLGLLSGQ
jgi:Ca2+-transporting ATPase